MPKKRLPDGMLPRRRAGVGRIRAHIVIFLLLGALLLAGGVTGRVLLKEQMNIYDKAALVEELHLNGMKGIKRMLLGDTPDAQYTALVNKTVSGKKRTLKAGVAKMVDEGKDAMAVLDYESGAILKALKENVSEEAYNSAGERVSKGVSALAAELRQAYLQKHEALRPDTVRRALPVTTPNYPLIYYYEALLAVGGVFLALGLALLAAYFTLSDEKKARLADRIEPADYLLPFFAGVMIFTLYPIVRVVLMSFQERFKLDGSFEGWGLGNYAYVLKGIEGTSNYFMQGIGNTFLFVLYTVPACTALAIVIAYLLNQKLRFSALFQTAYFLPMVTSVTAVGLVWRWIFNKNFGILNAILGLFGVSPVNWLLAPGQSMAVMVIFGIWNTLPFTVILLLSGLQNIDETYYTVARVDGARAWRIFRRITVPLLAPTIGLVLTINSISAFKVFTETTVLFNGNPGPAHNMYTVVYYIYEMMHQRLELGRAAAAAIVLFVFIFLFTMLQRWIQRKWNYT